MYYRAVTTTEADEAVVSSGLLGGGGGGGGQREREKRGGTESQLQLVLVIDHDTLSSLLVHYKSLLSVLEAAQSKSKGQVASRFIIYHYVLLKFAFIVVAVMLQYTLGYIKPLSILLQSESCDLVKAHQGARDLVL